MKETKIKRELMHKGHILSFYRDEVLLEDNRKTNRDVIEFNDYDGAVHCLCIDEDNNIVYTMQKRFNDNTISVSTVGGFIEKDEDPVNAMKREILEETGYEVIDYEQIMNFYPLVAYSYEKSFLFIVKVKKTDFVQKLDEFEELNIGIASIEEFYNLTKSSKCRSMNAKILINYLMLK